MPSGMPSRRHTFNALNTVYSMETSEEYRRKPHSGWNDFAQNHSKHRSTVTQVEMDLCRRTRFLLLFPLLISHVGIFSLSLSFLSFSVDLQSFVLCCFVFVFFWSGIARMRTIINADLF